MSTATSPNPNRSGPLVATQQRAEAEPSGVGRRLGLRRRRRARRPPEGGGRATASSSGVGARFIPNTPPPPPPPLRDRSAPDPTRRASPTAQSPSTGSHALGVIPLVGDAVVGGAVTVTRERRKPGRLDVVVLAGRHRGRRAASGTARTWPGSSLVRAFGRDMTVIDDDDAVRQAQRRRDGARRAASCARS